MARNFAQEIIHDHEGVQVTFETGVTLKAYRANWIWECLICGHTKGIDRRFPQLRRSLEAMIWHSGTFPVMDCFCDASHNERCLQCKDPYPEESFPTEFRVDGGYLSAGFCDDECYQVWVVRHAVLII